MTIYSPDLALRQPLTLAAVFPLFLGCYAQAVLAILPNTFMFKVLLLPFILWQAWKCSVGFDFGSSLAPLLGHQGTDRVDFWNFMFVGSLFTTALRAIEWTFAKKPLRRYESLKHQQNTPVERRLPTPTVLLDALDLIGNQRGLGWSWSKDPFPRESTPPPSNALFLAKTLFKLTLFDTSQYLIQCVSPAANNPKGGSIFDPNLTLVHRIALAAFCGVCGGAWAYALVESLSNVPASIGRILFRQPASAWPRLFHRPWASTSLQEGWNFRWHQLYRQLFVVFGARPGGALFEKPGAVMGAFAVSGILHHVGMWGMGNGSEFITAGGFFLLMGIGAIIEGVFTRVTGLRVRGWIGWSWTMLWVALWGTLMIDGWARHGVFATEFFPFEFRPGKVVVDAIIALTKK